MKSYEEWWQNQIVTESYYTIEQFKTILGNVDSRKAYLPLIEPGMSVLDIGCGLGLDYEYYVKNDIKVKYCGIDICKGFIEYNTRHYPGGIFTISESYVLPFKDGEFDVATIRHVLEHLQEPYSTLREAARVADRVLIIWFIPPRDKETIRLTRKGFYKNTYNKFVLEDYINTIGLQLNIVDIPVKGGKKNQLWALER